MNRPCPVFVDCPGDDSPIRNVSSEAPDRAFYCATVYYADTPRLGECWEKIGCATSVCSFESPQDALEEAQVLARECVWETWTTPGCDPVPESIPPTDPPPENPTREPVTFYRNSAQTCYVNCPDGTQFSYTVPAGRYVALNQDMADAQAYSVACARARTRKICLSDIDSPICMDNACVLTITATGNTVADSGAGDLWQLAGGALPPGLTFASGLHVGSTTISGTPTVSGSYSFSIRVTIQTPGNYFGDYMQKTYALYVTAITSPSTIDQGTVNTPYSYTVTSNTPNPGATWNVVGGDWPPGLTLNQLTGEISGTPTTEGTYTFTIALIQ